MSWLRKIQKKRPNFTLGDHNKVEKCRACKKPIGSWDNSGEICQNCAGEWEMATRSDGRTFARRKLRNIKGGKPYKRVSNQPSEIPGSPEWRAKYSTSTVKTIGYCTECGDEFISAIPEQRRQNLCDKHFTDMEQILRQEAWEAQLEAERLLYGRIAQDGE